MLPWILAIASFGLVGVFAFLLSSSKKELSAMTREVSDHRNRAVDIEARVESVKEEMALMRDLYIASDNLIHLQSEEAVYNEMCSQLQRFYHCNQLIVYSFDEEKRAFLKRFCSLGTNNFPNEISYTDMQTKEFKTSQGLSQMVLTSAGKPLFYIKMTGRRSQIAQNSYMDSLFTDADYNVLDIYIRQISMVLEKIKAYSKMERMALTDNLTGLYNRHYAYMRIKQEVKRANREGYPVSILFADIDKFKSINDSLGHDIGDLALKHVAAVLQSVTREYDIAIRWGGEEFVLFLPNTSEEGAMTLAERLRHAIETSNFEYCNITTSIGVSTYPNDNLNIEKVINYADSALYHSKQTGRNRCTSYSQIADLVK